MTTKLVLIVPGFVLSERRRQIQRWQSGSLPFTSNMTSFQKKKRLLILDTFWQSKKPHEWSHRRCMCLTISVLNYLLLKVIVPAAWIKKAWRTCLGWALSHRPYEGFFECLSLYDFTISYSNNGKRTSRERETKMLNMWSTVHREAI